MIRQTPADEKERSISREAVWILLLGLVIRLFAYNYTYIIVPDGPLYIYQARAILGAQWDAVAACGLNYLSVYPLLIVGAFKIAGDWVAAASSVSLLFGSALLFPIYFLLRRFFDEKIAALGTLIYALNPVLVSQSADVLRDPIFWFFLSLGVYFFIRLIDSAQRPVSFLAGLCFVIAAWARAEALLFMAVSAVFLPAFGRERRISNTILFLAPMLFLGITAFFDVRTSNIPVQNSFRFDEILLKLSSPFSSYRSMQQTLIDLPKAGAEPALVWYMKEASNNLWLTGAGTLLNRTIETFFLPFFSLFLFGASRSWEKLNTDLGVRYCFFLMLSGFLLLYLHLLQTWILEYRYVVLCLIPASVFIGLGLDRIVHRWGIKIRGGSSAAVSVLCLLILVTALPKNLQPRDPDKRVFREIGERIASREKNSLPVSVSTPPDLQNWISFYANRNFTGAFCPEAKLDPSGHIYAGDFKKLSEDLKAQNYRYFLWNEKHWPSQIENPAPPTHFEIVGRWWHRDTGRMILYAVK